MERYNENKSKDIRVVGFMGKKGFVIEKLFGGTFDNSRTRGLGFNYSKNNYLIIDLVNSYIGDLLDVSSLENKKIQAAKEKEIMLTKMFMQDFIIEYSSIIVIVINKLTVRDQKLLIRIKDQCREDHKKLIVIHNLSTFTEVTQVKDYIENTLLKSINPKEKQISNSEEENNTFFIENDDDLEVCHYIMANEESNAGNYYNNSTINLLRSQIQVCVNIKIFDPIKEICDYTIMSSGKYMTYPLEKDSIIAEDKIIKLANPQSEIKLRDYMFDETKKEFFKDDVKKLNYFCYECQEGDDTCFAIAIEVPGKIANVKSKISINDGCYNFEISGEREPLKEEDSKTEIVDSNIKYGPFCITVRKEYGSFQLKSMKVKKVLSEDGYLVLYYPIKKSQTAK